MRYGEMRCDALLGLYFPGYSLDVTKICHNSKWGLCRAQTCAHTLSPSVSLCLPLSVSLCLSLSPSVSLPPSVSLCLPLSPLSPSVSLWRRAFLGLLGLDAEFDALESACTLSTPGRSQDYIRCFRGLGGCTISNISYMSAFFCTHKESLHIPGSCSRKPSQLTLTCGQRSRFCGTPRRSGRAKCKMNLFVGKKPLECVNVLRLCRFPDICNTDTLLLVASFT